MSLLTTFHAAILIVYFLIAIWLFKRWKDNQIEKHFNAVMRKSLNKFATEVRSNIENNEKIVADAMQSVDRAKKAVLSGVGPGAYAEPPAFHEDAPMLASIMTALVYKYGDMSLGLEDMKKISDEDTVSVYVDTTTQELLLSTKNSLDSGLPTIVNFSGKDDETYH